MPGRQTESVDRAGIETSETVAASAPVREFRYVGTYEQIDTPMGGSISVLMAGRSKIKIAPLDRARYFNIPVLAEYQGRPLAVPLPELLIGGTYGVNGEWDENLWSPTDLLLVTEIEYFGGGEGVAHERERRQLPDFYSVDASGPLTMSELRVVFPDSLKRYFNEEQQACFLEQVERRAVDMGDPVALEPLKRVLLNLNSDEWQRSTAAEKRLQMARYVTSMALRDY